MTTCIRTLSDFLRRVTTVIGARSACAPEHNASDSGHGPKKRLLISMQLGRVEELLDVFHVRLVVRKKKRCSGDYTVTDRMRG